MNKKSIFPAACLCLIFGSTLYSLNLKSISSASSVNAKTLILYDAASGTIPSPPLMNFNDFPPGVALPTYSDGATVMNTTTSGKDTYAGWVASGAITPGFPILDRLTGFQVNFSIQVENESHTNNHRAGFNVIILSEDAKGIELAFWQNEIWAQSDENTGGLFKHGEGVNFTTTSGLIDYQVTILDDTYTLTANAQPVLTGSLRDYKNFDGFPDPYQTPNFIFLGDDTTSAESRVRLSLLSVTGTEPVVPTATSTSTSISSPSPSPTDSPTPLPSVTPLPSPTPESKGFEFCPSSGFLVMMIALMVIKRIGRVKDTPRGL
jgi:hypothetical protein